MRTKTIPIILMFFITLPTAGFINSLEVHGQETDYYYVGDKKVILSLSEKYTALSMKSGMSPIGLRGFEANVEAAGIGDVDESPILEKYGVVLIRRKTTVGPSSFRSRMTELSAQAEVESEIPVYSLGGTNAVLVNEFLVQFKSNFSQSRIHAFLRENNAKVVKKNDKIKNRFTLTFEGKTVKEALDASNTIHQDPNVVFSEPNFIKIIPARPEIKSSSSSMSSPSPSSTTPSDPLFSQQWALHNNGTVGVEDADVDATEAWGTHKGSDSTVIAIIDEGTQTHHPDLHEKIVTPYDATDGDNNQEPNPWDGHGTACAGIAAAMTDNGLGVAGVGWNIRIMPVRIATSNCGACSWITSNAIIEDGIRTAVDRGAHVLSNSWGGGLPSNAINSAIDHAISNNRVVVFAAGNDSGSVSYPANLSTSRTVIAVSATNEWDELKSFTSQDGEFWWGSNFGPEVNISAPGVHIHTTDITGPDGYGNGDYVPNFNGTSSATPFVAGAAALLLSQNPSMSPTQVRDRLEETADDLGAEGFDNQFGHGRLNVANALDVGSVGGVTSFTVAHSNKCLAIPGSAPGNGIGAVQSDCDEGENQQFKFRSVGTDTFQLIAEHSGKCLDIAGASTADGARLEQYDCHNGTNQQFRLTSSPSTIVAVHSGKCLDVAGASTSNGATVLQYTCHDGLNQQWAWAPSATTRDITAAHSNKCLAIPGSAPSNGVGAVQNNCDGGENQQFEFKSVGTDTFQLIAKHSGKCLDIAGASAADGARLEQYDCHNGTNQQFRLTSSPSTIVAVHSGKCLDVAGASTSNGATVLQYTCHDGLNQQWAWAP